MFALVVPLVVRVNSRLGLRFGPLIITSTVFIAIIPGIPGTGT